MTRSLATVVTRTGLKATSQTEKAEKGQKKNDAGGYSFKITDMQRAKRFLIMGSEGTFYKSGEKLSLENAKTIQRIAKDPEKARELIDLIVDVSVSGKAVKQQPGLFALALTIASSEDPAIKNYGYSKLNDVARTGTTLFEFATYLNQFQRFGMGARKALASWYTSKSVDQVAYQMAKYQSRSGFTHADILRISKRVKTEKDSLGANADALYSWATDKEFDFDALPKVVQGLIKARTAEVSEIPTLVKEYGLSWEMLPTESLNDVAVWNALLDGNVPLGALLRQLPRLTNLEIIKPLGGRTAEIVARLTDKDAIVKARLHPLQLLVALKTYQSGRSFAGSSTWEANTQIVDALDKAFYLAFEAVKPTGKRWLLALDVSGSMDWNNIQGMPITSRVASAAMSLVTVASEPNTHVVGFSDKLVPISISPRQRLDDVINTVSAIPMGGTDCALPMIYAMEKNLEVDAFVVYTDSETWAGRIHPHEALEHYRKKTGIDAKLIVVGMDSSKFSIANPDDSGMLDIAGFATDTPALMAEFVAE